MRTQRFLVSLTVINGFLLMATLFRASSAAPPDVPLVLRAHGLEIVVTRDAFAP